MNPRTKGSSEALEPRYLDRREQHRKPDRGDITMKHSVKAAAAAGVIALLAAAAPAAIAATHHHPHKPKPSSRFYHGCGVIHVPSDPWTLKNDNNPGSTTTGTHWIVDWQGTHGSCAFAKTQARKLVILGNTPGLFPDGQTTGDYKNAICEWRKDSGVQHYEPFQDITCALPYHSHRHTYWPNVETFIDPRDSNPGK
jgi:hypothetical protein